MLGLVYDVIGHLICIFERKNSNLDISRTNADIYKL